MSATNVVRGLDVLMKIGGEVVAAQRSCTIELSGESIDITTKQNYGWTSTIAGVKSWNCSLDGVVTTDGGFTALQKAFISGNPIETEFSNADKSIYYHGFASVTSLSISADMGDVITYSISLDGNGALSMEAPAQEPEEEEDVTRKVK